MSLHLDLPVPEQWSATRLSGLFRMQGGGTPAKDRLDYWNGDIPWVSPKDMKSTVVADTIDHITPDAVAGSSTRMAPGGSILLVVRSGILKHTIPVALAGRDVALNQDMKALVATRPLDTRYFRYFIAGWQPLLLKEWRSLGATVESLDSSRLGQTVVPEPPLRTQRAIADFLDRKTAAIDALIEKKARLLTLLAEKRAALIHQAVTKGLDPNVPMKDSGIPWIGEIPAHWEIKRLKFLVTESVAGPYGSSLTKGMYADSGYRVYGQQQVIPDDFTVGDYYISADKFAAMRRYEVSPGDILVSVMGTVGRVAVVPGDVEPGIINPRLVRYKPDATQLNARFLQLFLLSYSGQAPLAEAAQGSTMDGLNMSILGCLPIALPPRVHQDGIVRAALERAARVDAAMEAISAQLERFREYRRALITAAVTGQLDIEKAA